MLLNKFYLQLRMNFEILVEGTSDKTALWPLMSKILGDRGAPQTWCIRKHQGKGKISDNPALPPDPKNKTLLHNLCSKLRAYGNEQRDDLVVIVVIDLDDYGDCKKLKEELLALLKYCPNRPKCLFRIAIEEIEAWYFGDRNAILQAYPKAKKSILDNYVQDSVCNTWEKLADAIYSGGSQALTDKGRRNYRVLQQKNEWANEISQNIDVENNVSPSFQYFRDGIRGFAEKPKN